MFEIHPRVNRLRADLVASGFLGSEADEILEGLESEIFTQVKELVIEAVDDAMDIASSMGAEEFAEDVMVDTLGYLYRLSTRSGQTDYSRPPVDMKPHLLEKGKISKDGKRYRQVPLQEKSSLNDLFSVQNEQSSAQAQERSNRAAARRVASEAFAGHGDIVKSVEDAANARKRFYDMKKTREMRGEVKIRTVSDDSPKDSWVIPARDMDMTAALNSINEQLAQSIEIVIEDVVNFYAEEFA